MSSLELIQIIKTFFKLITDDSLEMLAAIIIQAIETGINEPVSNLIPAYEQLLINTGQSVTVGDRIGVIVGITNTCCLRLQIENGSEIYLKPGSISLG